MLFYALLVLMTILNVADLFLTFRFIKKWGLDLEANPLARYIYGSFGAFGMGVFKVVFSVGTVGLIGWAGVVHSSYLALPAGVFGALVLTWVVARNLTMVQFLSDLER